MPGPDSTGDESAQRISFCQDSMIIPSVEQPDAVMHSNMKYYADKKGVKDISQIDNYDFFAQLSIPALGELFYHTV